MGVQPDFVKLFISCGVKFKGDHADGTGVPRQANGSSALWVHVSSPGAKRRSRAAETHEDLKS